MSTIFKDPNTVVGAAKGRMASVRASSHEKEWVTFLALVPAQSSIFTGDRLQKRSFKDRHIFVLGAGTGGVAEGEEAKFAPLCCGTLSAGSWS